MTREEKEMWNNIEKLTKLRSKYSRFDEEEEPFYRALSLGIKGIQALEQESCDDAISRQAVTDTTICDGISCNECSFNTCEDGQPGCLLKERVDKLPSVNPQEPIDKSAMMYEIYMEGVNMSGEYQGCWVRFKDIEKIVDKYMGDKG